jgi:ribokinase
MYDIITIGSATTDIFVKTENEIRKHNHHTDVCYHLGDKLLIKDIFIATGGGGTNTAVAFSRLGLRTGFIGAIGDDANGQIVLDELRKEKVDFLGNIKKGNTGLSIILAGKEDRVVLAYKGVNNYLDLKDINMGLTHTKWLYVSSMLDESFDTVKKLVNKLKNENTKLALNISMYLAKQGYEKLSPILKQTDIFILNKEEAQVLTHKKDYSDMFSSISNYVKGIIVITDGSNSVHAFDSKKRFSHKVRKIHPVDNTGAGDAFASGFVYGIIKQKGIEKALDYGCVEATAKLKAIGAKTNLLRSL